MCALLRGYFALNFVCMAKLTYTLFDFIKQAASVFTFPGSGIVKKIVGWAGMVAIALIGIGAADRYQFTLSGASMGFAIAIGLFALWLSVAVGYGIAKCFRAKIVVDPKLDVSVGNNSIRLPVRLIGYGKPVVTCSVVEVRNIRGELVHHEDLKGLRLSWTHHPGEDKLELNESMSGVSVSVFLFAYGHLHIHGAKHTQPIHRTVQDQTDLWVLVRFDADNCKTVYHWVAVAHRLDAPLGYIPMPEHVELPSFCKPADRW